MRSLRFRMLSFICICQFTLSYSWAQVVCHELPGGAAAGVSFGDVVAGHVYAYTASGCVQRSVEPNFADADGKQYLDGCTLFTKTDPAPGDTVCPGLTLFAVVGQINGTGCFQLGTEGSFTAAESGELVLFFNDNVFADNSGAFSVCVGSSVMACSTIPELKDQINASSLNRGEKRALKAKLSLRAFVQQVRAAERSHQIDAATANSWVDCAEAVSPGSDGR